MLVKIGVGILLFFMYISFTITRDASVSVTNVLKNKKYTRKEMGDIKANLEVGWGLLFICSILLNVLLAYHFKGSW